MKEGYRAEERKFPKEAEVNAMSFVKGFLGGLLVGGMVGAGTMMLLAPMSGKRTRSKIQHQYDELRDQVREGIEEVEEDAFANARHAASVGRGKVKELQHRGRMILEQA